ncbi:MAG: S8 family serine peptidase [Haliscomenobacter sp.]|nr:S8 family serine peptidase [Haliscomenobacter sp.]
MSRRLPIIFLFSILSFASLHGQQLTHVQGELLVQLKKGVAADRWVETHTLLKSQSTRIRMGPCLSEELDLWKVGFDWTKVDENAFLRQVRQDPQVKAAQFNHLLQLRSRLPNDPSFPSQWHLFNTGQSGGAPGADLKMDLAWDISTGGTTPGKDTIVICMIDNGLDTAHQDIQPNLWVNAREIPNNGADDDNNGYIDDVHGWNTIRDNSQISEVNTHGTPVTGIAGARGNNGIGVSGVAWNVKLMHVVGGYGAVSEDRIIQAYLYPYRQRKRYNESAGQEGAFVVATNASWGLDRVKPAEYPIWCAFYDSLGQVGILNVAATGNTNIDVDKEGDMPTSCGSDFLISVNSLDHNGAKAPGGYGLNSVDLGAFGENVLSTIPGNSYGLEQGTSFAAPQVTGAIALMYAANCPTLNVLAALEPDKAAKWVKELLLKGVSSRSSLQGITVSGGSLNVYNSLRLLLEGCGACPPASKVSATEIKQTSAKISWLLNDSIVGIDLRWRAVGSATWNVLSNAISPISLSNLSACTDYEYQLQVRCFSDTLDYGTLFTFRTDGCCVPPTGIKTPFISDKDVLVVWDYVTAATSYAIRYRAKGTENWTTEEAFSNSGGMRKLTACTMYEYQVRSTCPGGTVSDWSPLATLRTRGCGACLELSYCKPVGVDSSDAAQEWIAGVKIHNFSNSSGRNGYGDFTGLNGPTLAAGNIYPITLTPGFPGFTSQEYWLVWIDLNQDGVFSSQEVVFDSGSASRDSVLGVVNIPPTAKPGPTRMRIVMRFKQPGSACSFSSDFFGEIEDYCVAISPVNGTQEPEWRAEARIFPNPFQGQARLEVFLPKAEPWLLLDLFTAQGRLVTQWRREQLPSGTFEADLGQPDWPAGVYFLRLRSEKGAQTLKLVKQE